MVGKKWPMADVCKSKNDHKEPMHSNFIWTDIKEIFNYFTFFSEEECYLNLSADIVEWKNTKITTCVDALA
jgi:hypothetical protein